MDSRVTEFHSIMPIANVASVMQHGILSNEKAAKLLHKDVSMTVVQEKRDHVLVPGGLKLHRYANVYFHARNPMMYKLHTLASNLCVLQVSIEILGLENTVIADRNGSSDYVRFLSPAFLDFLDFDDIYAQDWRHAGNQIAYWRHKSIKCAEVLVPNSIAPGYIAGAYVVNFSAQTQLINMGFNLPITINPNLFFA